MQNFLFFKIGRSYSKIKLLDILYIHAEKKHITIVTENECYFSMFPISQIEKLLPTDLFCRIHRSYIISLSHTARFDNELAYVGNKKIPIGEQYKNVLKKTITVIQGISGPFTLADGEVDKLLDDINP